MEARENRAEITKDAMAPGGNQTLNAESALQTFLADTAGKIWIDRKRLLRQDR